MEDKQLDLNQPFLSVRRSSSTDSPIHISRYTVPRPPPYKSELKSGPVRNPGVVPFRWEQSPGRPKDETHSLTDTANNKPPIVVPKLPPGRTLKAEQHNFNKGSESPIITKSEMESLHHESQLSKKIVEPRSYSRSNGSVDDEEKVELSDEDEAFVDALETISRTESYFLNCSASGLSGMNEPGSNLLGTSPTDPQTRDFMINRFLPAAQAMASEMPQYAPPRKKSIVEERPRHLINTESADRRPQLRYGPSFAHHYYQSHDYAEERNDDDDEDDEDEHEYLPPKVCGLIPRFCLKGSFFLMNPVPGMSVRTRAPLPPSSRMQTGSSSAGSCSGTENERSTSDVSEKQSVLGSLTAEPHENKNELEGEFKKRTPKFNDHNLDGILACHEEPTQCYEMKTGLSTRGKSDNVRCDSLDSHERKCKKCQESMSDQSNATQEQDSGSSAIEKTVYVDTVQEIESSLQVRCSPETKGPPQFIEEDREIVTEKREEKPLEDFPFIEASNQKTVGLNPLFSVHKLNSHVRRKPKKDFGKAQLFYQGKNKSVKLDNGADESSIKEKSEFLVPPPPPMSPSESWLCRTLPSLCTKNPSLQPYLGNGNPRHQVSKLSGGPKWETMVKTTKGHHQHLRYSQELMALAPIPETQ